jgi:nucleoside-diphosphate-sugar epimerase
VLDPKARAPLLPRIALTGATGFVGRAISDALGPDRALITALARPQRGRVLPERAGLRWVQGTMDQPGALADLCAGAQVVIHCAGATKALRARDFHEANVAATGAMISAAREAGVGHFVLLSSLAASRPESSDYAATKLAGEAMAHRGAGPMALTIVRAPAVIGPGDGATAPLFSGLARGWMPVPGGKARKARFSVIDVQDLAGLLISLAMGGDGPDAARGGVLSPFGHRALSWSDMAESAARVTGRRIRSFVVPLGALVLAGHGADLVARLTGRAQVFSLGKVREMQAGDWIGEVPLVTPTPIDVTMQRCLAPFQRLGNAGKGNVAACDRSPE